MLKTLLIILAAAVLVIIIDMIADCNRFVVRNYTVNSDKIKKKVKIVYLTDLHSKSFGRDNRRLLDRIKLIDPDMILLGGDMYTAVKKDDFDVSQKLIKSLALRYRVYYADGNHELKTKIRKDEFGDLYNEYMDKAKMAGVKHLDNERIYLKDENLDIVGLSLDFDYYKKNRKIKLKKEKLKDCVGKADDKKFTVLLAHTPEYFKTYAKWGADLVLSGHNHGGLMRLPLLGGFISPKYEIFPRYDYGVFKEKDSLMILSCGLGAHTLPIRIFNPGEISVITLAPPNKT